MIAFIAIVCLPGVGVAKVAGIFNMLFLKINIDRNTFIISFPAAQRKCQGRNIVQKIKVNSIVNVFIAWAAEESYFAL
jgi:hypothetical protein